MVTRRTEETEDEALGLHGEMVIRVPGDSSTGVGFRRLLQLCAFPFNAWRAIARRGIRPDLVISDPPPTVGILPILAPRLRAARTVYYFADSWTDLMAVSGSRASRILRFPIGRLESIVVRRSDIVVAVTEGVATTLTAKYPKSRVKSFLNGVDGSVFSNNGRIATPSGVTRPYFLYAGNFGEAHGASIFAEAADKAWTQGVNSFDLVYMGYGSGTAEIERIAAKWPERLHVLPPVPAEQAAAALRGAVAGLASLKPRDEIKDMMSVKALASIMCGTPLLYAGAGTFAQEVRTREYGYVVEHDPDALGSLMERLALREPDTSERERIASSAARKYDNRATAARLVAELSG